MKIKKFNESIKNNIKLEVGDYVIAFDKIIPQIVNFLESNIGQIIFINNEGKDFVYLDKVVSLSTVHSKEILRKYPYFVKYENVPEHLLEYFNYDVVNGRIFSKKEILHLSKNKEYLEYIIQANKYNL